MSSLPHEGTRRFSSLAFGAAALVVCATAGACSGTGDESGGGDGDGDGSPGTGGLSGDGDAGTGGLSGDGDVGTGGISGDGDVGSGGGSTGGGPGTGGNPGTGGGGNPTGAFNCNPPEGTVPLLGLEEVESGFSEPVLVTHAGDERLFVVQREGQIHVIENGTTVDTPFLDITSDVDSSGPYGEMGLLGLTFHPNHAQNGLLYVYYIYDDANQWGSSRLVEYSVMDDNPNQVNTSTAREILSVVQPDQNHNGGTVEFGPDGMLYLGLGDGGGGGDTYGNGQNETTLLGSLLRIDIDGRDAGAYSIPSGNLSEVLGSALPEIYSYGLRNPYRYNFDMCTGDLYIGDVGQITTEEVTIVPSGTGQLDYGWPTIEGSGCHSPSSGCDDTGMTHPQIEYPRGGGAAVIGGTVYRGSEIPALRGQYIYSDILQGQMWRTTYDSGTNTVTTPINFSGDFGGAGGIASIQNGYDGEIYVTNRVNGTVYKLVSSPTP